MAESPAVARSPIAPALPVAVENGWQVSARRSMADLRITDCTPLAKILVLGHEGGAFGVPFGRAERDEDGVLVVGSGPGEWTLFGPSGTAGQLAERVATALLPDDGAVFDLTHGRALVRLTGERSRDLLAKECGLDLADHVCPDGAALRSAVAGLASDLVRDDRDGARSYLLHCERSSGQYLFDSLLDAGDEFGVEADGFVPPGI